METVLVGYVCAMAVDERQSALSAQSADPRLSLNEDIIAFPFKLLLSFAEV
jgi:hypothetical protein